LRASNGLPSPDVAEGPGGDSQGGEGRAGPGVAEGGDFQCALVAVHRLEVIAPAEVAPPLVTPGPEAPQLVDEALDADPLVVNGHPDTIPATPCVRSARPRKYPDMGRILANDPSETDGLLRRAAEGDETALAELFGRYRKRLGQMVRLRLD